MVLFVFPYSSSSSSTTRFLCCRYQGLVEFVRIIWSDYTAYQQTRHLGCFETVFFLIGRCNFPTFRQRGLQWLESSLDIFSMVSLNILKFSCWDSEQTFSADHQPGVHDGSQSLWGVAGKSSKQPLSKCMRRRRSLLKQYRCGWTKAMFKEARRSRKVFFSVATFTMAPTS